MRQTVITNVTATPVNGGINPSFAAVEIAGDGMLGENPCIAAGATAELRLRRWGRDVIVIPYVR